MSANAGQELPPPAPVAVATAAAAPPVPHVLTMEELENTVRNGKKKLYWSAFEVVVATTLHSGEPQETRYDAYQVNHNHLKKIHAGAKGIHYVRVECKYCTAPRFTQSITVSTKKFEEHYMTLHALDALASADAKKAQQRKISTAKGAAATGGGAGGSGKSSEEEEGEHEEDEQNPDGDAGAGRKRARAKPAAAALAGAKRPRRVVPTKEDDAMQGAAAAVVALSGGSARQAEEPSAAPQTQTQTQPTREPQQHGAAPAMESSLVDSSVVLDPADSDTKRAKKSYWTAYEVVICERAPRGSGSDGAEAAGSDGLVVRETRQDAWRVNHNALRRLHLDPENETTVRVECRFCQDPKFNQSITVSTRKFEQHYYYEHGDETQRQELEDKLAAKLAEASANSEAHAAAPAQPPKRRKSWKALLMDRETAATTASSTHVPKLPYTGMPGGARAAAVRHQRTVLLNWLLHDVLPLSTADSDAFRAFAATLDRKFEAPQAPALAGQLQQRFVVACSDMKKRVHDERAAGTSFALSIDQFPVHSRVQPASCLSISAHFISHTWEREQLLLACRPVAHPPSDEAVRELIRSILDEFGIAVDALAAVVIRDEAMLSKAMMTLLASPATPAKKSSARLLLHCAASALQNVVQSGLHALPRDNAAVASLEAFLHQHGLGLSGTKWIDVHTLLSSEVNSPAAGSASQAPVWAHLATLLEPFVRVADDMSAASFPTIPMVFQYFRHLKQTLVQFQQSSESSREPLKGVVAAMQAVLEKSYDQVLSLDALVAYVLDPRFRFAYISPTDERRIRERVEAAIGSFVGESSSSIDSTGADGATNEAANGSTGAARQTRSLFEELATSGKRASVGSAASSATPSPTPTSLSTSSGLAEFDEYLGLDDEDFGVNVLQWWQTREAQFPTLSRIARRFLGLVGSSLSAENVFTPEGQQFMLRRSVLESDTLEASIVVRAQADSSTQSVPERVRTGARVQSPIPHKAGASPSAADASTAQSALPAGEETSDLAIVV